MTNQFKLLENYVLKIRHYDAVLKSDDVLNITSFLRDKQIDRLNTLLLEISESHVSTTMRTKFQNFAIVLRKKGVESFVKSFDRDFEKSFC